MSRSGFDPTLYLVTDRAACGSRGVVATVQAAVAGGVTVVQLRDHDASGRELYELAVSLRELLSGSGVALVVDDRLDVALAAGAGGVHLGQSDLPVECARAIAGRELVIGLSVGTVDEARAAAALAPGTVDYLGIGPVFATSTKLHAGPPVGVDGFAAIRAASELPCVAIGGVTVDAVADLTAAGASGVAVVTAICAASDPRSAAGQLRARWRA